MSLRIGDEVRFIDGNEGFSETLTVIGRKWVGTDRKEISYTLLDKAVPDADIRSYGSELVFVRGPHHLSRCPVHDYPFPCSACEVERMEFPPDRAQDAVDEVLKMHTGDRCDECNKGAPCPTRTLLLRASEV